jgi:RNA polymerase sigma-70 factor (ECF subfamily)
LKNKNIDILSLWKLISSHDDPKAFESLFYFLNPPLIKFSMMYLHQKEVAEEIVSDVFVKCWLNRKNLTEVRNIDTYLYVAVKNQSLNHLKKYSHIHLVQVEDSSELRLLKPNTPHETLEKKELLFKMEQSIEQLPQQCRIIFRLIKEEGIKYKEVAEILNISPRTVQTQLFRAMKKLSAVLTDYLNPTSASLTSNHSASGHPTSEHPTSKYPTSGNPTSGNGLSSPGKSDTILTILLLITLGQIFFSGL